MSQSKIVNYKISGGDLCHEIIKEKEVNNERGKYYYPRVCPL